MDHGDLAKYHQLVKDQVSSNLNQDMENGNVDSPEPNVGHLKQKAVEEQKIKGLKKNGIVTPHLELSSKRRRKLVLHFDIRNTILVADSVTNINMEQALNSYLTGVTWGRENSDGAWEWVSDVPSPYQPKADCMTYYKYMENKLVKTPSDRGHLRTVTGNFTQEPLGQDFLPYFKTMLNNLRWPHSGSHDPLLTMLGGDGTRYFYILPAFYILLQHLHETNRDFSIIIRTYGMDAPNVLKSIQSSLRGKHPRFEGKPLPYTVNTTPGKIMRSDKGITLHHVCEDQTEIQLESENDIYNFMSQSTGVTGYVDHFTYWQDHNYHFSTSKPHWVDLTDETTHHIIFDDNLRVTDEDSIVDVRLFPKGVANSEAVSLCQKEAAKFENSCLVLADLLDSTQHPEYFVQKVQECEENYEKLVPSAT